MDPELEKDLKYFTGLGKLAVGVAGVIALGYVGILGYAGCQAGCQWSRDKYDNWASERQVQKEEKEGKSALEKAKKEGWDTCHFWNNDGERNCLNFNDFKTLSEKGITSKEANPIVNLYSDDNWGYEITSIKKKGCDLTKFPKIYKKLQSSLEKVGLDGWAKNWAAEDVCAGETTIEEVIRRSAEKFTKSEADVYDPILKLVELVASGRTESITSKFPPSYDLGDALYFLHNSNNGSGLAHKFNDLREKYKGELRSEDIVYLDNNGITPETAGWHLGLREKFDLSMGWKEAVKLEEDISEGKLTREKIEKRLETDYLDKRF